MGFDPTRNCELSTSQARNGSATPKGNPLEQDYALAGALKHNIN